MPSTLKSLSQSLFGQTEAAQDENATRIKVAALSVPTRSMGVRPPLPLPEQCITGPWTHSSDKGRACWSGAGTAGYSAYSPAFLPCHMALGPWVALGIWPLWSQNENITILLPGASLIQKRNSFLCINCIYTWRNWRAMDQDRGSHGTAFRLRPRAKIRFSFSIVTVEPWPWSPP